MTNQNSTNPRIVTPQEARYNRWLAWYHDGCPEDCQPDPEFAAEWPEADEGESKAHYIVRNDIPDLMAEVATEPERIAAAERAAVVDAVRGLGYEALADAIENGAPL